IQQRGLGSALAPFGESFHDYGLLVPALADLQGGAGLDFAAALAALAVAVNLAAFDGLRGQRTRLEDARGPQPFVDAQALFPLFRLLHAVISSWKCNMPGNSEGARGASVVSGCRICRACGNPSSRARRNTVRL